jgi:Alginate lyase
MRRLRQFVIRVCVLWIFFSGVLATSAKVIPRVFSVSPSVLPKMKARLATNDASLIPAFRKLTNDANRALDFTPLSVLDKPRAGASGDKHDYLSQAPYFWPDPAKPDGLPYIRKDGQRNPESGDEHSDAPRLARTADAAETLSLAYFFTRDERYAAQAAKVLRVWFLNPATRMNPNFNQAQAIPGVNTGRGIGMIESRSLMPVCDAVGLLAGSTNWTKADDDGMQKWVVEFLHWAQTSANGRDEQAAKNNHGSWYDAQVAHYALFTGNTNLARQIIVSAQTNRIARQIKIDGTQPLELARADSFSYSRFNLQALFEVATLGEHVGVDLWHFRTPGGASLRKALDFLLPYAEQTDKPWPYEVGKKEARSLDAVLWQAAKVYRDERLKKLLEQNPSSRNAREVLLIPLN